MHAADAIRIARARAGLSQRDLAERAGTSAAAVCLYERGERVPRVDTLRRIINAAGSVLELVVDAPPVDLRAAGRDLEQVLLLADHLPSRHDEVLTYPVLRDLVR